MAPAKALLALLVLTPLATAQSSSSKPVSEIPSNVQGPYYIPNDPWVSAFSSPSYSALYPFDAPDVSKPYPAPMIAGWSVSVAVQDDIPLTSATPNQLNATEREKFIAGVRVALNPPPDLRDGGDGAWKLDASWRVCYSQTSLPVNGTLMRRLASDDGSCGGLWSSECLRKMESSMRSAWVVEKDSSVEGGCPFIMPSDCSNAPSDSSFSRNAITAGEASAWELGDSGVGSARGVQVMGWGTEPRAEGDARSLELARRFVNPLIIAFGPEDRSKADIDNVKVQIVCPRAKEEGEVGQSEGAGLRGDMALVLGLALGLAFYLV